MSIGCQSNTSRRSLWVALSFTLTLATSLSVVTSSEEQHEIEYLEVLPYQINDTTFQVPDEPTICYDLIGCVKDQLASNFFKPSEPEETETQFNIYRTNHHSFIEYQRTKNCLRNDVNECKEYPFNITALKRVIFDPSKKTLVITAGYWSGKENGWQVAMKNAWLKLEPDANVIIVSWYRGNHRIYDQSVANTRIVARQISALLFYLAQLNECDFRSNEFTGKIHLIGHSLGAHISGFVGKDFRGSIGRITGLDPAGPKFRSVPPYRKLDSLDATFVEAVHTNDGDSFFRGFGHAGPLGHVDYYVNDGHSQPGCSKTNLTCSHKRAPHLYVAFLEREVALRSQPEYFRNKRVADKYRIWAIKADNYEEYLNGSFAVSCTKLISLGSHSIDPLGPQNHCAIPVNFVSSPSEIRDTLIRNHQIDLQNPMLNAYYFNTDKKPPFINDHYLLKLKFEDPLPLSEIYSDCKISVRMNFGSNENIRFDIDYNLITMYDSVKKGHYFVRPLVSDVSDSLGLAELSRIASLQDPSDDDYEELKRNIRSTLPRFMMVSAKKPERSSRFSKLIDMLINRDQYENTINLNTYIESLTIEPLIIKDRSIILTYSVNAFNIDDGPTIVDLRRGDEPPTLDPWNGKSSAGYYSRDESITFMVDKVILGHPNGIPPV